MKLLILFVVVVIASALFLIIKDFIRVNDDMEFRIERPRNRGDE